MSPTRPASERRRRLRPAVLLCGVLAATALLVAACGNSGDSSANAGSDTTAAAAPEGSSANSPNPDSPEDGLDPNQPQQITVGAYTFTMKPETNPADVPFPAGTFADIQGFEISKDGSTVMTAYSTTLPEGQSADAGTVDRLVAAAGATDPTPGEVQGQPFTSATLPDGRVLILAASGDQVAVAVGQNREQMVNALTETAQTPPSE